MKKRKIKKTASKEKEHSENFTKLLSEIGTLTSQIQGLDNENYRLKLELFRIKRELAVLNKIAEENSTRDKHGETLLEHFMKDRKNYFPAKTN